MLKKLLGFYGCSESSIRKLIRNKEIPFFRIGVKINFTKDSLEEWIEKQQELNSRKFENVCISIR